MATAKKIIIMGTSIFNLLRRPSELREVRQPKFKVNNAANVHNLLNRTDELETIRHQILSANEAEHGDLIVLV